MSFPYFQILSIGRLFAKRCRNALQGRENKLFRKSMEWA
jgi:hypothetical protein